MDAKKPKILENDCRFIYLGGINLEIKRIYVFIKIPVERLILIYLTVEFRGWNFEPAPGIG